MRPKLVTGIILLLVAALVFALKCGQEGNDSAPNDNTTPSHDQAPSDPRVMDPNATSPDEQGESGSLIDH